MRIDLQLGNVHDLVRPESACRRSGAKTAVTRTGSHGEEPVSSSLREAARIAMEQPEIRNERVQQLREAIQAGSYKPDPEAIAGAMIEQLF